MAGIKLALFGKLCRDWIIKQEPSVAHHAEERETLSCGPVRQLLQEFQALVTFHMD